MNKRLSISLYAVVLSISSSLAMAESCPPNTACPNGSHSPTQKTQPYAQQPTQSGTQKQSQQSPQQAQHNSNQALDQGSQNRAKSDQKGGGQRIVRVTSARLRSGPGADYPVIKGLNKGDKVEVIKVQGDWAQVRSGNTLLWVAVSLLSAN